MAVIRTGNWLGQQRVDLTHLRSIESGVRGDFDVLAGRMMAGKTPLVIKGFNVIGTIGSAASTATVTVADASLIHFLASEAGSIFWVPTTRAPEVLSSSNANVTGSFTAGNANYVGIDLVRSADPTTTDTVQFYDPNSGTEIAKIVPLAQTLNYKFVISTSDFNAQTNVLPIAKITTDSSNNITAIQDARNLMFRLGSGGSFPNNQHIYPWPGTRYENLTGDVFSNGDKAISSLKDWQDAIMTRLWELGGGEYWYSATADRNVRMVVTGTPFSNGENFTFNSGTGALQWKGVRFLFDHSTGYGNDVADGTATLTDGDCLYVDLDRTQNHLVSLGQSALTASVGPLTGIGTPVIPGSRQVIAWRSGSQVFTRNGCIAVGNAWVAGNLDLSNATLPAQTGLAANVMGKNNFTKAWGSVQLAAGVFTVTGTNLLIGSWAVSGTEVTVTFNVPFSSATAYSVNVNIIDAASPSSPKFPVIYSKLAGSFKIGICDSTFARQTLSAGTWYFDYSVQGNQ